MLKKVAFSFAVLGLVLASAKSYTVKLSTPAAAGNTELNAGAYTLSVTGQTAVITGANGSSQSPVRVETAPDKFKVTSVKYNVTNGKKQIQEIQLEGTKTKLVFIEALP